MGKRRRRGSPVRSKSTGLLFVLVVAVVIGAAAGVYLGRNFTVPYSTGAAVGPTPEPPHATAHTRRHARRRATPETKHSREEAPKQQVAENTGATQAKAEVTTQETPKPAHNLSTHQRRMRAYAGEIAHGTGTTVALTFDAGSSGAPTPDVLRALRAAGLHVTFFLTGKWCEKNEELVRQIKSEGHEIGNHTYSHPDLRKLTDDEIKEQLGKTDAVVYRITGEHCAPYFRPPFGGRDKRVLKVAEDAGYTPVYWSVDSWDAFKKGITSKEISDRVLERVQGGDIVLMHCGSQPTADALPGLIRDLESRGYGIGKVSELTR